MTGGIIGIGGLLVAAVAYRAVGVISRMEDDLLWSAAENESDVRSVGLGHHAQAHPPSGRCLVRRPVPRVARGERADHLVLSRWRVQPNYGSVTVSGWEKSHFHPALASSAA